MTTKTERFEVRLPTELLERFRQMSDERGVTASMMVRHIMNHACKEHESAVRQHLQAEKHKVALRETQAHIKRVKAAKRGK